jgi:hypothetical protein
MSDEIKVSVVEFGDRSNYQLQWVDPATGRKRTKSSGIKRGGTKQLKLAQQEAGKHADALKDGRYCEPSKTTWEELKDRYHTEVVDTLADATGAKVAAMFALVERHMAPPPKRPTSRPVASASGSPS